MHMSKVEVSIIDKITEFAYVRRGVIVRNYFSCEEKHILRGMQLIFF